MDVLLEYEAELEKVCPSDHLLTASKKKICAEDGRELNFLSLVVLPLLDANDDDVVDRKELLSLQVCGCFITYSCYACSPAHCVASYFFFCIFCIIGRLQACCLKFQLSVASEIAPLTSHTLAFSQVTAEEFAQQVGENKPAAVKDLLEVIFLGFNPENFLKKAGTANAPESSTVTQALKVSWPLHAVRSTESVL